MFISLFFMTFYSRKECSNPLADKFTRNFATMCPKGIKENSDILETLDGRVLEFWLPVWQHRQNAPPPPWVIGLKGKNINFIVNNRLKEAKVKFLIEHDKMEFKNSIVTLYNEETPDTNISDTSNELKQILVHNCFYISGKAKT